MTDAISFNILCKGQLEYFSSQGDIDLTMICGGNQEQLDYLRSRNVGKVIEMPLLRKPNFFKDIKCLLYLWYFFIKNRFDLVVYSTPKALLLGSVATFFSFHPYKLAIVQGRVYENFTGLKRKIFEIFDKISFIFSNKVVFVSNSLMSKTIEENLIKIDKSLVIGSGSFNGVNIVRFSSNYDKETVILREELGFSDEDFIVCSVGRLCKDKGVENLEKIINSNKLPNLKFLIVGSIEDELSKDIINRLSQKTNFNYLPHISDIENIFKISNLHLFLSFREGFGNVAIEAASCNVPTFAYDVVGVKDSVQENISGLRFAFQDVEGIAKAIQYAVENPQKFKDQFSNSRDWAIHNFEQKRVWKNYLDFYQKIVESKFNCD